MLRNTKRSTLSFSRSFTRDRDLRPTNTIFLRVHFKTLGEFVTSTQAS